MSKAQLLLVSIMGTFITIMICMAIFSSSMERAKGSIMHVQDSIVYTTVLDKCLNLGKYSAYECRRSAEDASKAIMSWDGNKWVKAN